MLNTGVDKETLGWGRDSREGPTGALVDKRAGGECGLITKSCESGGSAYGDKREEEFCFFMRKPIVPQPLLRLITGAASSASGSSADAMLAYF